MRDSERISAWRGERRIGMTLWAMDYENNPAAWTPELYALIEKQGLEENFVHHLMRELNIKFSAIATFFHYRTFKVISATPEQKALALTRAIEEAK